MGDAAEILKAAHEIFNDGGVNHDVRGLGMTYAHPAQSLHFHR